MVSIDIDDARPRQTEFGPDPIIVAYGAGVDSTALLTGLRRRRVVPELIPFADTGSEKRETTAYLDTINAWLDGVGFPRVVTVMVRASGPR